MLSSIEIEHLLRFNPEDLEQNRLGRLSERQKQRLASDGDNQRMFGASFGLVLIGIGVWSLVSRQQYLVGGIFILLASLFMAIMWLSSRGSINEIQVQRASGYLQKKMDESSETSDYYFFVDTLKIQVDQKIYDAFHEGDLYTLYYYHRSILSWLSTGPHLISGETSSEIPPEKNNN